MAKTGGAGSGVDYLFEGLKDKASKGLSETVKPDEVKHVEGKTDAVISVEVKPDEVKHAEGKSIEDKTDTVISVEVKPDEIKPEAYKPAEDKSDEVKIVEDKSDAVKPLQVKPDTHKPETGKPYEDKPAEVKSEEEDNLNQDNIATVKPLKVKVLREAVDTANSKRQRIAVWSPVVSATMWYLKTTTPLFSISDEARCLIEEGLERKYPELYKRIKEEMEKA